MTDNYKNRLKRQIQKLAQQISDKDWEINHLRMRLENCQKSEKHANERRNTLEIQMTSLSTDINTIKQFINKF